MALLYRFDQLADILVLWGYTMNFSTVQGYDRVESDVITVYARDLGNNIPRLKIFKPEPYSRRLQEMKSAAILNQTATTGSDDMTMTEIESNVDDNVDPIVDSTTTSVSAAELVNDSSSMEISSYNAAPEDSVVDDTCNEDETTILFAKSSIPTTKKRSSRKDLTTLSPDEPVLMASKSYEPLFIFWQLMDWYNAGTDERVKAPDVLGCVELPLPSQCFGEASSPYGQKQRDLLIAHLRDEKSQLMPWPLLLKSSFSKPMLTPKSIPIYGSPTLDAALGKVDSIMKVLDAFGVSRHSKSVDELVDTSQFDNILPPEMPTQWVQCDDPSCRR